MNEYSVLMSVYFKEKPEFLKVSIESVMSQTILPSDFVLVEDGPLTDELYSVIGELKEKYSILNVVALEQNSGLGAALSYGLTFTKYDIVMRMDSDDICAEKRAEIQLPLMEKYDLVGGYITEFENTPNNKIGTRKVPENFDQIWKFMKKRNPFNHPSVMYKKKEILNVGSYQHLLYFEDYFLWVRFLLNNKNVYNVSEVLVNMRSGSQMRARRGNKKAKQSFKYLRKFMYKNKIINFWSYVFGTALQLFVLSLPIWIKTHIYTDLLRD